MGPASGAGSVRTILSPIVDPAGVLALIEAARPGAVEVVGDRRAWQSLTIKFPASTVRIAALPAVVAPEEHRQAALAIYRKLRGVTGGPEGTRDFLTKAVTAAPLLLHVACQPEFSVREGHSKLIGDVASYLRGMVFDGASMLDANGRKLLDVDGNFDATPDPQVVAQFRKLSEAPPLAPAAAPAAARSVPPNVPAAAPRAAPLPAAPRPAAPRPAPTRPATPRPAARAPGGVALDLPSLQAHMVRYLRGPGRRYLDEFGISPGATLFLQFLALLFGLGQVLSIYWFTSGLKTLKGVFTPAAFEHPGNKLKNQPERLTPMALAGIIVGPHGHALAVGSFDRNTQLELSFLAAKAQRLGHLYAEGSNDPRDAELTALLKDDRYRPYRRRAVPPSHADGRSLTLFDIEIDKNRERTYVDGTPFYLFAAATEEDGACLVQLPWNLTQDPPLSPEEIAATLAPRTPYVSSTARAKPSHRRAVALAVIGVLLLGACYLGYRWVLNDIVNPRPARWVPPAAAPRDRGIRKWTYVRDENGRGPGYFERHGTRWEEYKEGAHWGTYDELERDDNHVLLKKRQPALWVRLDRRMGRWSWDQQNWTTIGEGRAE